MASKIRDRILSAAVLAFAERGFHGISTKEIATRADVTEGSLFRLFGSKTLLFFESLDAVASRLAGRKRIGDADVRFLLFALLENPTRVRAVITKRRGAVRHSIEAHGIAWLRRSLK